MEFRHNPKRQCMAYCSCIWKDDTESTALYSFHTLTLGVGETVVLSAVHHHHHHHHDARFSCVITADRCLCVACEPGLSEKKKSASVSRQAAIDIDI